MENLMTLQPYLNQLRPRKESYVEHVDRIQNLLIVEYYILTIARKSKIYS